MNKFKWILPLIVIALMLGGCPYNSEIPLDTTSKRINPSLLGKWEAASSNNEVYSISAENEVTYRIVKTAKTSTDSSVYKGYIVDLDGDLFLNLWEENSVLGKGYNLYKLDVNPSASKVVLYEVTDNITEKFTSGAEMKAFFQKYRKLSFFYNKTTETYIKD